MQWPTSVMMLIGSHSLMVATGEMHSIRRSCLLTAFTRQAVNGDYTIVYCWFRPSAIPRQNKKAPDPQTLNP